MTAGKRRVAIGISVPLATDGEVENHIHGPEIGVAAPLVPLDAIDEPRHAIGPPIDGEGVKVRG